MLVIKSFFRRKETKIYLLIFFFIFFVFNLLFCFREYMLNDYDKNFSNSYFYFSSNNSTLELKSDLYYVDKYEDGIYYINCKHWYYYADAYHELYNDIKDLNVEINENIEIVDKDNIEMFITLFIFISIILVIGFLVVFVIMIFNIKEDIRYSNKMLNYLGFSKFKVLGLSIINVLLLTLIPLIINLVIFLFINIIML